MDNIPIWKKICLTIDEASEYSNIGQHKLREMLDDPMCNFVLVKGTHKLVKREQFEEYIKSVNVI